MHLRRAAVRIPGRRLRQQGGGGRHGRRHRGHLPRRRRAEVPGADLALHEPERRRGPVLPDRPARLDVRADRRRDVVRRLHPRAEHDRRDDRAGQRLRDRGHAGQGLPADPAGHEHQPVRLQARPDRAQGPDPRGRLRRLRGHDPGLAAALQGQDRVAPEPPARVPLQARIGHRGRRRPRDRLEFRPAGRRQRPERGSRARSAGRCRRASVPSVTSAKFLRRPR